METNGRLVIWFAAVGLVVGACGDTRRGDSWRFKGNPGDDAGAGAVPEEESDGGDVVEDDVEDVEKDDTEISEGPDEGDPVEAKGLSVAGSQFLVDYEAPTTAEGSGLEGCPFTVETGEFSEQWYTEAMSDEALFEPLVTESVAHPVGVVKLTGKQFVDESGGTPTVRVEGYQVKPCETYDHFGGCLKPTRRAQCFRPELPESSRERLETEVLRKGGSGENVANEYEVTLDFGIDEIADGGSRAKIVFNRYTRRGPPGRWNLNGAVKSLAYEFQTFGGYGNCEYRADSIEGWALDRSAMEDGEEILELHVIGGELDESASDEQCLESGRELEPFKIWGAFEIDMQSGEE